MHLACLLPLTDARAATLAHYDTQVQRDLGAVTDAIASYERAAELAPEQANAGELAACAHELAACT